MLRCISAEVHDWLPISWIEILYSRAIPGSTYMWTGAGTLNPTIRANRQVVVRQYTRGLRIALEFNDVLVSVVRGHELSLRAAAEATNVLNCLDVHCEIPFCGGHAELGTDQRRDHVLRGGKEVEREGGCYASVVWAGVNRRAVRVRRRHYATFSCLRYQRVVELEAWQVKSPAFSDQPASSRHLTGRNQVRLIRGSQAPSALLRHS